MDVINQGLAITLILAGVSFAYSKLWPYFTARDAEERARRYDIDILQAQAQIDAIKAQQALAHSIALFADVLGKCIKTNMGS